MRKTYPTRLTDLQKVLANPLVLPSDYGFVIRQFLAHEAIPITKKHKKSLLTPQLIQLILPYLSRAHYPSGSAPITTINTLTFVCDPTTNTLTLTIVTLTYVIYSETYHYET